MKTKQQAILKFIEIFILLFLLMPLYSQQQREIRLVNFQQFEPTLHFSNDTTYVINFWATWCVPCRKELPQFEKIHKEYSGEQVKVILVSLDFPNQIQNNLIPFLINNSITAEVLLLNDPNSNSWIDKVDPTWSGSLPATLFYNQRNRKFFEKELDYDIILNTILEINNP